MTASIIELCFAVFGFGVLVIFASAYLYGFVSQMRKIYSAAQPATEKESGPILEITNLLPDDDTPEPVKVNEPAVHRGAMHWDSKLGLHFGACLCNWRGAPYAKKDSAEISLHRHINDIADKGFGLGSGYPVVSIYERKDAEPPTSWHVACKCGWKLLEASCPEALKTSKAHLQYQHDETGFKNAHILVY